MALPLTMRQVKSVITEMSEGNLRVCLSRNTLEATEVYIRTFMRPVGMGILLIAGAFFILLLEFTCSRMLAGILFSRVPCGFGWLKNSPGYSLHILPGLIYTHSPQFEELLIRNPFACGFMFLIFKKRFACYVLKQKT